ncbi:hypothetical protein [Paraburkholderia phosphatilytica]|uniref:hypothetical protein n=1 Tax=Paraburkholderia phosphatilytica TaxID=2282883 RepID=UPI000F5F5AC4|nr:hypothetical protein [Paraburkholderia phosphatilytica]
MSQVHHPRSSGCRPTSSIDAGYSARATRCLYGSLALLLVVTLAACGNDDGTSGAQTSANAQQDSSQSSTPQPTQQAALAPSGDGLASPVMHYPQ